MQTTKERDVLRVWPSSAPRINDCAGSAYPLTDKVIIVQPSGAPAREGQAIHALAGQIVRENLSNCPDATGYALDHDVLDKLKDITIKGIYAAQMWQEIRGEFDLETVEVEKYSRWSDEEGGEGPILTLSGYTDVVGLLLDGVSIGIVDWKSGLPDFELVDTEDEDGEEIQSLMEKSGSVHQLKCYAKHALEEHPDRSLVKLHIGWLSERYYITATYTREEIDQWWSTLQYKIRSWDGKTFAPGTPCKWCRNAIGCPGREKYMGVAIKVFDSYPPPTKGRSGLALDDSKRRAIEQRLSKAYAQCSVLESHIKIFKANLKQEVEANGPIPDGEGKAIGLINVTGKTVIDVLNGWPDMVHHLGGSETDLKKLLEISSSTLKKAIKDRTDRGEKQPAVDSLIADLEEVNAVIYKPGYQRFGMVKDPRQQPAIDI